MEQTARDRLIDRYEQGNQAVLDALDGAGAAELDARPGPGEWTAREVVHHLADSETMAWTRLRRLLAEDDPVIQGYDQDVFAHRLHYDRSIDASLATVAAVRAGSAELLRSLRDDEWGRSGTHTESGPYSVETWLTIYADHAHDHADQIRRARARAGAPSRQVSEHA